VERAIAPRGDAYAHTTKSLKALQSLQEKRNYHYCNKYVLKHFNAMWPI